MPRPLVLPPNRWATIDLPLPEEERGEGSDADSVTFETVPSFILGDEATEAMTQTWNPSRETWDFLVDNMGPALTATHNKGSLMVEFMSCLKKEG